jgi:apolipoprotein N-acyltransferase
MSKHKRSTFIALSSVFSGVLLWLAWPERGYTPLIFIAFVPLLFAEHKFFNIHKLSKGHRMFGNFYLTFLTWNFLTTWWIYNASDVGSVAAILVNSFFMALIWQLFFIVRKGQGSAIGYTSLVIFWIAFEYLHLNWEISWPWLTLGNVFATMPTWIQWYEYTGVLGGSLWVLVINLVLFQLLKNLWYKDLLLRIRKINVFLISTVVFVLIACPLILSLYLYYNNTDKGEPVNVVVTQPNIDPYNEKFSGTGDEQLAKLLRLSLTSIDSTTDFCFWPETALPDGIREEELEEYSATKTIRKVISNFPRLKLITGLTSFKTYETDSEIPITARKSTRGDSSYFDVFNSAMLLTGYEPAQIYHKSKLVPGVEKMPYPKIFGFLENYAIELGGTSGSLGTQDKRTNFVSPEGIKVAPAICYESIYGDFMSGYIRDGAEFIVVITNDGWWGNTPGYRQHMQYGRLIAISFRKHVARSANTGISAFFNQRGDILQQSEWWKEDVLKQTILKNNIITFYARHGDYIGFVCSYIAVTLIIYLIFRKIITWF